MEGCPESVETTGRLYAAGERAAALPGSAAQAWRGVALARNFDGDMLLSPAYCCIHPSSIAEKWKNDDDDE
jgi:hypothetical protein